MQRIWIILVMFVVMSPLLLFADINEDLIEAAKNGRTDEVRNLLDAGAEVNAEGEHGETALMWATENGHFEVGRVLLNAGADVNARSEAGLTALMGAAFEGRIENLKVLLDAGADVNVMSEIGTAMDMALAREHDDIVELLKQAGAKE